MLRGNLLLRMISLLGLVHLLWRIGDLGGHWGLLRLIVLLLRSGGCRGSIILLRVRTWRLAIVQLWLVVLNSQLVQIVSRLLIGTGLVMLGSTRRRSVLGMWLGIALGHMRL